MKTWSPSKTSKTSKTPKVPPQPSITLTKELAGHVDSAPHNNRTASNRTPNPSWPTQNPGPDSWSHTVYWSGKLSGCWHLGSGRFQNKVSCKSAVLWWTSLRTCPRFRVPRKGRQTTLIVQLCSDPCSPGSGWLSGRRVGGCLRLILLRGQAWRHRLSGFGWGLVCLSWSRWKALGILLDRDILILWENALKKARFWWISTFFRIKS